MAGTTNITGNDQGIENSSWLTFGVPMDNPPEEVELTPVATDILETFNIPYSQPTGGTLKKIDLKRVSPIATIKASLLELFAESNTALTEMIVGSDGEVDFYKVGEDIANINPYYTIKSTTEGVSADKVGVMITGGKPQPLRKLSKLKDLIGGQATTDKTSIVWDATNLSSSCVSPSVSTVSVVTFKDPHVEKLGKASWNDGVEDLFEPESEFDRIIGYVWSIDPGENIPTTANIYPQNQTSIPILISPFIETYQDKPTYKIGNSEGWPELGTLKVRSKTTEAEGTECWTPIEGDTITCDTDSLTIDLETYGFLVSEELRGTTVNKVNGVSNIFVKGIELGSCRGVAKDSESQKEDTPTSDNVNLFLSMNGHPSHQKVIRLEEGVHYVVAYKDDDYSTPCIRFANNAREKDLAKFGSGVDFIMDISEALKGFFTYTTIIPSGKGTVLPTGGTGGILVEQVWAQLDLDTPSFMVNDPTGNANRIAHQLSVKIAAMSVVEKPSPIAINGELVDLSNQTQDNDPTTKQNFEETDFQKKMQQMDHGRTLSLGLASLSEEQTINLCKNLYEFLQSDTGITYNHVCPPTDEPEIGSSGPNGGIINSIEYSYTDQGSYTINVTEGPKFFGDFSGISGGIYHKKVENISADGIIIQDAGNHVNYTVRLEGIGDIKAVNGYSGILSVRDKVSVTIYNNEVED